MHMPLGQPCAGLLSASYIRELDAYLAKAASELARKPNAQRTRHELLRRRLAERYAKKYADFRLRRRYRRGGALRKVRNAMRSGKPLFPDANDPDRRPDVDELITAKVTGEKCHGVLTLLELAEIELYLARQRVWWAARARAGRALGHRRHQGRRAGDRQRMEPKGLYRGWRGQGEEGGHPGAKVADSQRTLA